MSDTDTESRSTTNDSLAVTPEGATPSQAGGGRGLATLALLVAIAAIAVPFYPDLRLAAETYLGPVAWLPERIGLAPVRMVDPASGSTPAPVIMPPEFAEMQASIAKLSGDVALLDAAKNEASVSLKSSEEAAKQMAALQSKLSALETSVTAGNVEMKAAVSGNQAAIAELQAGVSALTKRYADLSAPGDAPLLAAKLTLLAVNGTLAPEDIDPLAGLVGSDPALADAAAQVKALTGGDVLTVDALQTQFSAAKDGALQRARRLQLTWLEAGLSTAHALLSDLGFTRPHAEEKDELVIAEATRQMNNGRLERALFELQAASPELRQQLAPWISAAQLRINLDTSIQQLIDGLMQRQTKTMGSPDAG